MKLRKLILSILCLALLGGCSLPSIGVGKDETPEATEPPVSSGAGGAAADESADDRFTLSYVSQYGFNPLVTTSTLNLMLTPLIYEPLFELDEHLDPVPKLVTDYGTEDGIYWYFTVDTSVQFHDGSYLTAADAAYSVQRAMYSERYCARLHNIAGVSSLDETQFVIRLGTASAMLPALLDVPVIKYDSVDSSLPPGTGPYQPSSDWTRLELFTGHRDASEMPLSTIYLREYVSAEDTISSFESSELDLVTNDPTGLSNLGYGSANEVRYYGTTCMHYLGFNVDSLFFQLPERRSFLTYAVDRERIVTSIMGGAGTASSLPISPVSTMFSAAYAESLAYSPDKLVKCLVAADILDHDNDGELEYLVTGVPMEIDIRFIVNNESAVKVAAARQIAEELRSYGIPVTLRELSWSDYLTALEDGDFDMYYGETMLTADFDLRALIGTDGALNYGGWRDDAYDTLTVDYLSAPAETRQMALEMLQQYIGNSAPIVPICFEKREVLTHRDVVSGMTPTSANLFYNFRDWTIALGE